MQRSQFTHRAFALALLIASCGLAGAASLPQDSAPTLSASQEARFDHLIEGFFAADAPGGVALLAKDGVVLYHKAFGLANLELGSPITKDTRFRIASVTKPIIATAILQLVEQGRLSLSDPIAKHFPKTPAFLERYAAVTIEHMLSHTSGLHNYNNFDEERPENFFAIEHSPEELLNYFASLEPDSPPGERYAYSNTAYAMLGMLLERISGQDLETYLTDQFFVPLGMTGTSITDLRRVVPGRASPYVTTGPNFFNADEQSPTFNRLADGGLESTAMDLYRWCEALTQGRLIDPSTLDAACQPFELNDGSLSRVGHGWFVGSLADKPFVAHDGLMAGFSSSLVLFPEDRVVAVLLSNCNWYRAPDPFLMPTIPQRMAADALGLPYADDPAPAKGSRAPGVYEASHGERLTISISNGTLMARQGSGRSVPMRRLNDQSYFIERGYSTIELPPGTKPADHVIVHRGTKTVYQRTNAPLPRISLAASLQSIIPDKGIEAAKQHLAAHREDEAYYLLEEELQRLAHALYQEGHPEASLETLRWSRAEYPASPLSVAHAAFAKTVESGLEAGLAEFAKLQETPGSLISEDQINLVGYSLLQADQLDAAIAFFEANVRLHPESWNAHDSLAEAYRTAGQHQAALQSYRTAVTLNPGHLDGVAAIHGLLH